MPVPQVLQMFKSSTPCLFLDLEGSGFEFKTSNGSCYSVRESITIIPVNMRLNHYYKMIPHKEVKRLFEDCEINPILFEEIKKEFPQIKFVVENPPSVTKKRG